MVAGAITGNIVSAVTPPWNITQIESVVNSVISEGNQPLQIDGVPEPKFGRNPTVEPILDVQTVAALWRCR